MKSQIEKDNPLSWSVYEKKINSIKYGHYTVVIDPIAKYPGSLEINYKYKAVRPNYIGSGLSGHTLVYPFKVVSSRTKGRLFTGFDSLDLRVQCFKKDIVEALKKLPK